MTVAEVGVLRGEKVRLRPFADSDVPLLRKWLNDPDVLRWLQLSEDPPELMQSIEAHMERWQRIRDDPRAQSCLIETKDGLPIGEIGLMDIRRDHGRADLGISIGEREYRGRGYGADAIRTLLRYAFGHLGLRRVGLIADEDNARAIRCYEKCGFAREGLLRAYRLRHGQPVDMVVMSVLRDARPGPVPSDIHPPASGPG